MIMNCLVVCFDFGDRRNIYIFVIFFVVVMCFFSGILVIIFVFFVVGFLNELFSYFWYNGVIIFVGRIVFILIEFGSNVVVYFLVKVSWVFFVVVYFEVWFCLVMVILELILIMVFLDVFR